MDEKEKKVVKTKLKRAWRDLILMGGLYVVLVMLILIACIWQVDAGAYRIIGTLMVLLVPLFLYCIARVFIWNREMNKN